MNTINLAQKLATFTEHWQPRTVGQFNGHDLMVVKVKGEFVWHKHEDTDERVAQASRPWRAREGRETGERGTAGPDSAVAGRESESSSS